MSLVQLSLPAIPRPVDISCHLHTNASDHLSHSSESRATMMINFWMRSLLMWIRRFQTFSPCPYLRTNLLVRFWCLPTRCITTDFLALRYVGSRSKNFADFDLVPLSDQYAIHIRFSHCRCRWAVIIRLSKCIIHAPHLSHAPLILVLDPQSSSTTSSP